ncbi:MAG TPA: hypothetical protein VHM90_11225 [Phycisphaerae bacterium]|nr:hypothetical protein [Phycisphaerae bacterium]
MPDDPLKSTQGWLRLALMILALGAYAVGIGYNLAKLNENERRIGQLESQMTTMMPRDDVRQQLTDIKDRLDKLDQRMERMTIPGRREYLHPRAPIGDEP